MARCDEAHVQSELCLLQAKPRASLRAQAQSPEGPVPRGSGYARERRSGADRDTPATVLAEIDEIAMDQISRPDRERRRGSYCRPFAKPLARNACGRPGMQHRGMYASDRPLVEHKTHEEGTTMSRFTTPAQAWAELMGKDLNPNTLLDQYTFSSDRQGEHWLLEDALLWHLRRLPQFNIDDPEWLRSRQHPDKNLILSLLSLYMRDLLNLRWSYRFVA